METTVSSSSESVGSCMMGRERVARMIAGKVGALDRDDEVGRGPGREVPLSLGRGQGSSGVELASLSEG